MFQTQYAKYYDIFNDTKPYKKEVNFVYRWAEKPKWIFDIGCGTANYWKYFPKKTMIQGIEKSKYMRSKSEHDSSIFNEDITTYQHSYALHGEYDLATSLFDVINYIPTHDWWKNIPVKKGGYFIFDIWDKKKVDYQGFFTTVKMRDGVSRTIECLKYNGSIATLNVNVMGKELEFNEEHTMYIHSEKDIKKFCGKEFEIVDTKSTETWQKWYKLQRK